MQIKTGLVVVTQGSNTITGVGVDWSQVTSNCLFVVQNVPQSYLIVGTPVLTAGVWSAVITPVYQGVSSSGGGVAYTIQKDFTPFFNLPVIASGDVETATILARAFQIIDINLGTGGGGSANGFSATVNQSGNNFVVGTALRIQNTMGTISYAVASSDTQSNALIVGIVTAINVGGNSAVFTYATAGIVTIAGSPLTAGSIYYLTTLATSPVNFTSSIGGTTLNVPLFIAISTSQGLMLNFGIASAAQNFGGSSSGSAGFAGLVPAPPIGNITWVLRAGGTWGANVPDAGTLNLSHLNQTPAFPNSNWATLPSTSSVYQMLLSLYSLIAAYTVGRQSFDFSNYPTGTGTFVVPSGVTSIRVTVWGAGGIGPAVTGSSGGRGGLTTIGYQGGGAGGYVQKILTVNPGASFAVSIGNPGVSNSSFGAIADLTTYILAYSGSGSTGGSGLAASPALIVFGENGITLPNNQGLNGTAYSSSLIVPPSFPSLYPAGIPILYPGGGACSIFNVSGTTPGYPGAGLVLVEW